MIYLLFIALLLILILDLILRRFDILRPATWVIIGFVLGSFFGVINKTSWGDISIVTVIVVWFFVFLFTAASYIGESIRFERKAKAVLITNHFPKYFVLFMNTIMILTSYIYIEFMFQNALLAGSTGSWSAIFSFARQAEQLGIASEPSLLLTILLVISFSFGYVQAYIVIKDMIYNIKVRMSDLLSMILYFSHTFLSGGRTKMMYFILFIIVIGLILYRNKNNWSKKSINVGLKYVIFGFIFVVLSFWIIEQTVRGSIYGNSYSLWYQLSKYIGSPIYALDIYLRNPNHMQIFADTETLYPVISILNRFGMDIPFTNNALDFVSFAEGSNRVITNIYTAIRRYIHDYRFTGTIFIILSQSIIYSSFYTNIKKNHTDNINLLFYGIVVYPVAFYFIEERFINDLFTLSMILQYIMILFFISFLKKKGIGLQKSKFEGVKL